MKLKQLETKRFANWKLFGVAAFLFAMTGLGVASAQLTGNRPVGAVAEVDSEGTECASGIAIDATIGMFCSRACESHSDCTLAGWGCRQVYSAGTGEREGICFPRRHVANPASARGNGYGLSPALSTPGGRIALRALCAPRTASTLPLRVRPPDAKIARREPRPVPPHAA